LAERKPVRSYVLRQGRISAAQTRALETLHGRYGVAFRDAPLDARALFGRSAPLVVEVGSGMGETTARIAAEHPDTDYVAIEVHAPGVGSLLKLAEEHGLANLRVIRHDALEVLQHMIPDASLAGLHLFFPDPWPKKRHHKRRLIQPAFVALLATRMKPGAYLHAATDWEDYAAQMLEVLRAEATLVNTAPGFAERPATRPETKFEQRGLKLGHRVWDLVFRKP